MRAADIISLKEHNVPDEIAAVFVKRNAPKAESKPIGSSSSLEPSGAAPGAAASSSGPQPRPMDPESYDFWWYHYAYPRALASANERLLSSYYFQDGDGGYYGGYLPPLPFQPVPPSAFSRPLHQPLRRSGMTQRHP